MCGGNLTALCPLLPKVKLKKDLGGLYQTYIFRILRFPSCIIVINCMCSLFQLYLDCFSSLDVLANDILDCVRL